MNSMDARSAAVSTQSDTYAAPPTRDRLPTLPEDLSEYAWIHTGPPSWESSRVRRATALEAETRKLFDEPSGLDEISAGVLVDLWHSDVPVVDPHVTSVVDERDARILSLVDGVTTIGTLLETSQMSHPEFLGTLCDLCARGVVTLDRSRRPPR